MKRKRESAIYIRHNPEGAVYIGSTTDLETRLDHHKHWRTKSTPSLLKESFEKFGEENHTFYKLLQFDWKISKKELVEFESMFIRIFEKMGCKMLQVQHTRNKRKKNNTLVRKEKMVRNGERVITPKPHKFIKNSSPIIAFEYSTKAIVKEFASLKAAASEINVSTDFIYKLIKKPSKKHCLTIDDKLVFFKRKKRKQSRNYHANSAIIQINKITNEEIARFESLAAACDTLNINRANVSSAAYGRIKSAGGYVWKWA